MTYETEDVRNPSPLSTGGGDCPEARMERIYQYLDGALESHDFVEVKAHIQACTDCQSEHDLEVIIRDVVKRSCDEKAPHTLKTKIMLRIDYLKTNE